MVCSCFEVDDLVESYNPNRFGRVLGVCKVTNLLTVQLTTQDFRQDLSKQVTELPSIWYHSLPF